MNPSSYFNLLVQSFQNQNPILEMIYRIQNLTLMVINYNSNLKLNKFRYSLYMQQLNRMEQYLAEGAAHASRGAKIDRKY